jgi:hypothetical protein
MASQLYEATSHGDALLANQQAQFTHTLGGDSGPAQMSIGLRTKGTSSACLVILVSICCPA